MALWAVNVNLTNLSSNRLPPTLWVRREMSCDMFVHWRQLANLFVISSSCSQLLRLWNRPGSRVSTWTEHRLPGPETGEFAAGQRWTFENHGLWIRQEVEGPHVDVVWHPRVFSAGDYPVERTQQGRGLVGIRWVWKDIEVQWNDEIFCIFRGHQLVMFTTL